jgi:hypothetical protein
MPKQPVYNGFKTMLSKKVRKYSAKPALQKKMFNISEEKPPFSQK